MSHPFSSLFSVIFKDDNRVCPLSSLFRALFKDERLLRKRLTISHLPQLTVHFSVGSIVSRN